MTRRLTILCALVLGCSDAPAAPLPSSAPIPAEEPTAPVEPSVEAPLEPGALAGRTWTYFESTRAEIACGLFGGEGRLARCDTHVVGDPRTYQLLDVEGVPHLSRRDGEPGPAQTLVFDEPLEVARGASLVVTSVDTSSYEVLVAGVVGGDVLLVRADGATGQVEGSRTIAHLDADVTGVQLVREEGRVVLFARAVRPWMALLSLPALALLDRADAGLDLVDFDRDGEWTRARSRASLDLPGAHFEARNRSITGPGWTDAIDDPFRCAAYALGAWQEELVMVYHCPASSGARMRFYDRVTGHMLAEIYPGSIGSIGHSMYHADVDLLLDGENARAFLRGNEAGGRYRAVVDLENHRTLGVLIWRQ